MKIIMKQTVTGLAKKGELVQVKAGYARNFLIPNGKAMEVSEKNQKIFEEMLKQSTIKREKMRKEAQDLSIMIANIVLEINVSSEKGGKIFASVNSSLIQEKLKEKNINIEKKDIKIIKPIKSLGSHIVSLKLYEGIFCDLKLSVLSK